MNVWLVARRVAAIFGRTVLLLLLGIGTLLVALILRSRPSQTASVTPVSPRAQVLRVVALGDSYMSGEGASTFYDGTDVPRVNTCRRSPTAYPILVERQLSNRLPSAGLPYSEARVFFAACSGARTVNIGSDFSFQNLRSEYSLRPDSGVPQFRNEPLQIETLKKNRGAKVVLLGIGGNDSNFSEVVLRCAGTQRSCVPLAEEWLEHLDGFVQPRLRSVFSQVRDLAGPQALVYATTYPNPFAATECPAVGMDRSEIRFLTRRFIPRLNDEISLAANASGIRVIDLVDVFGQTGLCGSQAKGGHSAMNGFRWQRTTRLLAWPTELLRGSMHPTEQGHALIARVVFDRIMHDLTAAPSLRPSDPLRGLRAVCPPDEPDCQLPPTPPPFQGFDAGTPEGPWKLDANPCTTVAMRRKMTLGNGDRLVVSDGAPGSAVCFRTYQGDWHVTEMAANGGAILAFDGPLVQGLGGWRDVVYRAADNSWVWMTIFPPSNAPPAKLTAFEAWLGLNITGPRVAFAVFVTLFLQLWLELILRKRRASRRPRVARKA